MSSLCQRCGGYPPDMVGACCCRESALAARIEELERHLALHPDRCTAEAKCLPCRTAEEAALLADRYEAALAQIVRRSRCRCAEWSHGVCDSCIARAALAGKEEAK